MRPTQILLLLPFLALSASCGGAQRTDGPSRPPPKLTTVEVRNLKHVDFNVYVQTGIHRVRLGLVPAMTSRFFAIPPHVIGAQNMLRFEFDMIGSDRRSFSEDPLPVHAGDRLSLAIQ